MKAFDALNNVSEQSNTVIPTDTEPPSAPTYLTVTSMTATSISLSWTASTDNAAVAGYDVFRNNVQVGSTALTTYMDSGLITGGTYTYFLKAYDASGNISDASSGVVFGPLWQDALETGATGWTHSAATGSDGWVLTTAQSHSTTRSYFAPGPASVSDSSLVSPAITIPANATTLQLSFWHNYTFQSGVDGGVLEFSLDNGLWFDAVSSGSGGTFTNGGYNATLASTGGNPNNRNPLVASGSRPGWSDTSNGWTQATVSITASNYAGKSLRVRWRLGTNSSTASAGWYVDDIAILIGGTAANLAPTITQVATAAPAVGSPGTELEFAL